MNALKKVFRPGSAWVRVNHRYPDREGGRILAPAGTPVRVQVERVLSDAVEFKTERGTISYLAWPQPPLQVNISPDKVEISDNYGALLTYTKAPSLSEGMTFSGSMPIFLTPERIVRTLLQEGLTAAIMLPDGRKFTGPAHCMALAKMYDAGLIDPNVEDEGAALEALGAKFGWLDEEGSFLTRNQGYRRAVDTGEVDDVYGPNAQLTHDMLDDEQAAWNIDTGEETPSV